MLFAKLLSTIESKLQEILIMKTSLICSKTHLAFAIFCLMLSEFSNSGVHYEEKDDFDGSKFIAFRSTKAERSKSELEFFLTNYNPSDETFLLIVGTEMPALVDCGRLGLEIKTSTGVIHKITAERPELTTCTARVKLEWVRKSFSVRVPMYSEANRVGVMDTTTLKPERYIMK